MYTQKHALMHTQIRTHMRTHTHTHTQVILDVLNFAKRIEEAIPYKRLHHQLYPNYVSVEPDFPNEFREGLEERNHKVKETGSYAVVQGIHVVSPGVIHAVSDPRKGGKPDGY